MVRILAFSLIFCLAACVDRIFFDIRSDLRTSISVDGFISNEPGPYTVHLYTMSDIDSKDFVKTPIIAQSVIITDNLGNSEDLTLKAPGTYETGTMQGVIGRSYKLTVAFRNGAIVESLPDTILSPGTLASIDTDLNNNGNNLTVFNVGTDYGFDVYANSSLIEASHARFLWSCVSTYKLDTHAELTNDNKRQCHPLDNYRCNYVPLCSGLRNVNGFWPPTYERIGPCTCCTCWYETYNSHVIIGDEVFSKPTTTAASVFVDRIPLSPYIFYDKVHVQVSMKSLTRESYNWWKTIYNQRQATGSLFQPVTGKIPVRYVKLSGPEVNVQGIFYACGVSSKSLYLSKIDVPKPEYFGKSQADGLLGSCLEMFPNATTAKPVFWED